MRLSELYTSIQGEGPHVGEPVQFMRFAGCNLRCPAWPCDTQHAIDPAYRSEWENVQPTELADRVSVWPQRIVYTGGEPFLQPRDELLELTEILISRGHRIEAFTNGTLPWPTWTRGGTISMVMDWKLPGSGEKTVVPNRFKNVLTMTSADSIKFTVASYTDFTVAVSTWKGALQDKLVDLVGTDNLPRVYCGAVWGKVTEAEVAEWVIAAQLPWYFNSQIHNHIWDRDKRGI